MAPGRIFRRLARHHELVAGGEQRHARPARHLQRGRGRCWRPAPGRRGRAGRRARSTAAAARDVFAAAAYPLARHRARVRMRTARRFSASQCFLHHDRVGAGGHRRAGEDAGHRAGLQRLRRRRRRACAGSPAAARLRPATRRGARHSRPSSCCPAAARAAPETTSSRQHAAGGVEGATLPGSRQRPDGVARARPAPRPAEHRRPAAVMRLSPSRTRNAPHHSTSHSATASGSLSSSTGRRVGSGSEPARPWRRRR